MDRDAIDQLFVQLEDDPELQAIQKQLAALEARIKTVVSDEAWELVLEWESLWAQYVTRCMEKLQQSGQMEDR
jgi:hypothetical protein